MPTSSRVLALNGGSSTLKFACFTLEGGRATRPVRGKLEGIGTDDARIAAHDAVPIPGRDRDAALGALVDWLEGAPGGGALAAVGHRIVHGMEHVDPERITPVLVEALRRIAPCDPDHLPAEVAVIEAMTHRLPGVPQVACFDTAFHRNLPRVAAQLPVPRRLEALGVRRYGFHGLSYQWLMEALVRDAGVAASRGRVVLAHLGGGASLAAVQEGRCIDTTMSFTPSGGLPMGTRSGDLDPGLLVWLARTQGLSIDALSDLVNRESGLLGISETSGDMRQLLAREAADARAAEAVALYCARLRQGIGAFAATLGGLDTIVFSGGIGEHAAAVRARACEGLGFLGVEIDRSRNEAHAPVISADAGRVAVRVIPTDEENVIVRATGTLLALPGAA